ncbi:dihydrolipoyl dehydrogenase [Oxalobacter sp. OttesenSCG-928-P03]|nr:dihydrolipoyl dehydrogenase [Oxalobacter sp. OttesenSCG-928-P03]
MSVNEIRVPDIGDFKDVDVIEVMVKSGDRIEKDQSLVTVESDKASMEIPSPRAGVVREVRVKIGDRVSEGTSLILLESEDAGTAESAADALPPASLETSAHAAGQDRADMVCDTLVLGAGPGGYTAAFRAADLGQKVVLVERYATLGGVCLNVGCIPSKALLHAARVIAEADEMAECGIRMGKAVIEVEKLRDWKNGVVGKLTAGLSSLAQARQVQVVQGIGTFTSPHTLEVETAEGAISIRFAHAIIAAGSSAAEIPGFPYTHPALVDSTGALELRRIPEKLLVIGGGIIGLEMACAYDAFGSRVTVVEAADRLILSADADVVRVLESRISKRYDAIYLNTRVTALEEKDDELLATFEGEGAPQEPRAFDMVLVAVGRRPNGRLIGAEKAGVSVDERGYIPANSQQRTNVPHIFAIGDICGEPMLAHKASAQGKVAAEVIAGKKAAFDVRTIPSVAYTDPEIAWMGLTEKEAQLRAIPFEKTVFPWSASGRALTMARTDGLTKLIWDPQSKKILGGAIAGVNAGELLAELVLALEMGADLDDVALTVHAHPSLSETTLFAAEAGLGSITDLYLPKKRG